MELTEALNMQELKIGDQQPRSDHCQGWPENFEKGISECQAIGQLSESKKETGHVNNPRKGVSVSGTPAKQNLSGSKIPLLDRRPFNLVKEGDIMMFKCRETAKEKQQTKNLGSCAPSCGVHMKENIPSIDFVQNVKLSTQESDSLCKLDLVSSNINKENEFHVPAKIFRMSDKPRREPLVDKCVAYKPVIKETTSLFGDVISPKQKYQRSVAESQPAFSYKSSSKIVQEYAPKSEKEFYPVSTAGIGAVKGRNAVQECLAKEQAVQECLAKEQAVQPKPDSKLVHKQVQPMALKPGVMLDNVTVNGKVYRVLELLGGGCCSKVFRVS